MNSMRTSIYLLILFFSFPILCQTNLNYLKNKILSKTVDSGHYAKFNINNISTFIYNNGNTEISPDHHAWTEFPKGSKKSIVYESGFLWGGIINGDVHVSGSTYSQGLLGGKILNYGSPQDPEDLSARVFRVRPG